MAVRLLSKEKAYLNIAESHRPQEARFPFRVDLRDFASWTVGDDPFSDDPEARLPAGYNPNLRSFLVGQVRKYTAQSFSVDDLYEFVANAHVSLVLDGFDEVADVGVRNILVREIGDAAARLEQASSYGANDRHKPSCRFREFSRLPGKFVADNSTAIAVTTYNRSLHIKVAGGTRCRCTREERYYERTRCQTRSIACKRSRKKSDATRDPFVAYLNSRRILFRIGVQRFTTSTWKCFSIERPRRACSFAITELLSRGYTGI